MNINIYCYNCGRDMIYKTENVKVDDNALQIPVEPCHACLKAGKEESYYNGVTYGTRILNKIQ